MYCNITSISTKTKIAISYSIFSLIPKFDYIRPIVSYPWILDHFWKARASKSSHNQRGGRSNRCAWNRLIPSIKVEAAILFRRDRNYILKLVWLICHYQLIKQLPPVHRWCFFIHRCFGRLVFFWIGYLCQTTDASTRWLDDVVYSEKRNSGRGLEIEM